MASSKSASQVAVDQPILGGIVGVALTYFLASDTSANSKILLSLVTPISVGVDRAVVRLFRWIGQQREKKAGRKAFTDAIAELDAELNNENLPPAHKDELQNLRLDLLKNKITSVAYNQPAPSSYTSSSVKRSRKPRET
jgi:hypothetical protein